MADSLESVNEKLDELLQEFFEKIEELQSARSALANTMKSGFLLMSKARYSMGNKSVSSLQYDSRTEATVKIITKPKDEFNTEKRPRVFQLYIDDGHRGVEEHENSGVVSNSENLVRRRQGAKKAEVESAEKSVKKLTDPLKWFGVLVPSCLRQCQQEFKSSCQLLCEIAELECEVNRIICAYNKLKELKYTLQSYSI